MGLILVMVAVFVLQMLLNLYSLYGAEDVQPEPDGSKVYRNRGPIPVLNGIIGGIALVTIVILLIQEGFDSIEMVLLGVLGVGVFGRAVYLAFFTPTRTLRLGSEAISWRDEGGETSLPYRELASATVPKAYAQSSAAKRAAGGTLIRLTTPSGTEHRLDPDAFADGTAGRHIVAELRRRLEAAGVPYTE